MLEDDGISDDYMTSYASTKLTASWASPECFSFIMNAEKVGRANTFMPTSRDHTLRIVLLDVSSVTPLNATLNSKPLPSTSMGIFKGDKYTPASITLSLT